MAGIRAILLSVCTDELAEYECECETDSDMVRFFLLEDKFKSRERAVRIQGFAEEVVPNCSLSTFREHFRLTPETFEKLVCELGNCCGHNTCEKQVSMISTFPQPVLVVR